MFEMYEQSADMSIGQSRDCPERRLWIGVLLTFFADAKAAKTDYEVAMLRHATYSQGPQLICEFLDLNYRSFIRAVERQLAETERELSQKTVVGKQTYS